MFRRFRKSYHVSKNVIKRSRLALAKKFTGWTLRTPKLSKDMEIHLLLNSPRRKYNVASSSYEILETDIREVGLQGILGRFTFMASGSSEESEISSFADVFDMKYILQNNNVIFSP